MALRALKLAGVDGVMVDVWWGVVERKSPLVYDWSVYQDLFKMVAEAGLKLQVVLSFHACAESLMDLGNCIDLPLWVTEVMSKWLLQLCAVCVATHLKFSVAEGTQMHLVAFFIRYLVAYGNHFYSHTSILILLMSISDADRSF